MTDRDLWLWCLYRLSGGVPNLETWWDGTVERADPVFAARDVWKTDEDNIESNGRLVADDPASMIIEDSTEPNPDPDKYLFGFNQIADQDDQRSAVPDDPSVSPAKPVTVSAWIPGAGPNSTPSESAHSRPVAYRGLRSSRSESVPPPAAAA